MPLPLIPPTDGKNHLTWPDGSHDVSFASAPVISQAIDSATVLRKFDGRQWPLAYFQEHSSEHWDVDFMVDLLVDGTAWDNLRLLVDGAFSRNKLVWTDVFGYQINCVVNVDPVTRDMILGGVPASVSGRPLGGRFQRVKFTIHRVE